MSADGVTRVPRHPEEVMLADGVTRVPRHPEEVMSAVVSRYVLKGGLTRVQIKRMTSVPNY